MTRSPFTVADSTGLPHAGQLPSSLTDDGVRYFAHGSHQGTSVAFPPHAELQGNRTEPETLPDGTFEIPDVRRGQVTIHEQGERGRVGGALQRVQHTEAVPCGLALLAAGLAFCYMTQIARYVETMKLAVGSVRLVQFSPFLTGSTEGFDTHLFLNGEAPDEVQTNLLTIAARTCYLHATMAAALPPLVSVKHNGSPLR